MQFRSARVLTFRATLAVLAWAAWHASAAAEQESGSLPGGAAAAHAAAEGSGAGSGGESGGNANPLAVEPALTFWTVLVFAGLLAVLGKYAWKPLIAGLERREEHMEHVLKDAERSRNDAEALLVEHKKLMAKAGDEVRGILDQARRDALAVAEQINKQAQAEAEASRQRAQRDIAAARDQALGEIWEKTADMAVHVAGRVLAKQLDASDQRRLFDAAAAELPQLAGAGGGRDR